jgi:hypothetical protein
MVEAYITPEAKQRLDLYVKAAPGEISGLGRVIVVNNVIYIEDIYLLKQSSTGSSTDLNPEAMAEFIGELIAKDSAPEEIKLWWHSHGNMSTFWSATDEETAGVFANGWMLSLVVNKKNEHLCRLDVYDPVHLVLDKIPLIVSCPLPTAAMVKAIEAEVKEKVDNKSYGGKKGKGGVIDDTHGFGSEWVEDGKGVWKRRALTKEEREDLDRDRQDELLGRRANFPGWGGYGG